MRVVDDLVELGWEGPLSSVGDLPAALLYSVVLTFTAAGPAALEAVRRALEPLLGPAAERRSLLGGGCLAWAGRTVAEAAVSRRGDVELRFGQRVKGRRLEEVVAGLAAVPGARDLRLRAAVRRFGQGADEPMLDG